VENQALLKTLNAELPVFNGEANVAGYSLQTIKTKDIPFLRRKIGVVFQDFKLFTDRSIYKNLHFVLKSTGWTDEKAMNERIDSILEEVWNGCLQAKNATSAFGRRTAAYCHCPRPAQ
jgi:cell division transport system ATP-binding protein